MYADQQNCNHGSQQLAESTTCSSWIAVKQSAAPRRLTAMPMSYYGKPGERRQREDRGQEQERNDDTNGSARHP